MCPARVSICDIIRHLAGFSCALLRKLFSFALPGSFILFFFFYPVSDDRNRIEKRENTLEQQSGVSKDIRMQKMWPSANKNHRKWPKRVWRHRIANCSREGNVDAIFSYL